MNKIHINVLKEYKNFNCCFEILYSYILWWQMLCEKIVSKIICI